MTPMDPRGLHLASHDGVATLTLSRPEKRNALNGELVAALTEALAALAADPAARVVALRGAGPDFCAGADLAELERVAEEGPDESLADARRMGALFAALRAHPTPVVAVVQGRALAGGCGLATACDLVLAREDAEFGYPEVQLGFVPALVMTILRRKVTEGAAFELVALGGRVGAERAAQLGLANRVLPTVGFDEEVAEVLRDLASLPPSALRVSKALLYELDGLGLVEGLERGAQVNAAARGTPECREGVRRFLDRARRRDGGAE